MLSFPRRLLRQVDKGLSSERTSVIRSQLFFVIAVVMTSGINLPGVLSFLLRFKLLFLLGGSTEEQIGDNADTVPRMRFSLSAYHVAPLYLLFMPIFGDPNH